MSGYTMMYVSVYAVFVAYVYVHTAVGVFRGCVGGERRPRRNYLQML